METLKWADGGGAEVGAGAARNSVSGGVFLDTVIQGRHVTVQLPARGWFPGGVLFAELHGYDEARRVTPGTALGRLLRSLGVRDEHVPADEAERARLYVSVLAAFAEQGRRVLVVLDDVSSAEQVRPLLPGDGATGVLVTSRGRLGELESRRSAVLG
ncbi:hypothetical protein [Streptomyces noursei]|uniref:hypothetical protein n=1 Tax=Streptomyces noursei TaxID=1971 RepID=UPI00381307D6